MSKRPRTAGLAVAMLVLARAGYAQEVKDTTRLPEVSVYGSRAELAEIRKEVSRQPGGVAMIEPARIAATRRANLKDVLRFVPGVYVAPRFGAADESQISIRGSGLRNNFHARGVNLLVNGMPYRNADGFTDFESLELMNTEAIQVYKGGNAFRLGGSTLGGAINLQTRTGYSSHLLEAEADGGAFGYLKTQIASGGARKGLDYYASYTRTSLDGYRDWSRQGRDRVNAHLGYVLSPSTDVRAFYFFAHVTERLPGSLTATEFAADPQSAVAGNVTNRWGRDYDLHHLGVQLRTQLSPTQRIELSPYFQYRDIDHPIFQVINQQSRDLGAEVRYENSAALGSRESRFTLGVQPSHLNMDNRQFVNVGGQHGDLRKDQTDHAGGVAVYAEEAFSLTPRMTLIAGLRYDRQTRRSEDHFLTDGDQSDSRVFESVLPRAGLLVDAGTGAQFFANVTRSVEPPLLLELNSLAVPGFVDVKAQRAWQFEAGTRGRSGLLGWELSLYDIELRDEILNINVQPFPNAPFTVPTYRPSVSVAGGTAHVVWYTGKPGAAGMFYSRRALSGGSGSPAPVPLVAGKNVPTAHATVVATMDGGALAAWDLVDAGSGVTVARLDSAGNLAGKTAIAGSAGARYPQLVALRDGTALLAWTTPQGSGSAIRLAKVGKGD